MWLLNALEIAAEVVQHCGCRERKRKRAVLFKVVNLLCYCPPMQITLHLKIHGTPAKKNWSQSFKSHMVIIKNPTHVYGCVWG